MPSLGSCALLFALIHLFEYGIEHVIYLLRDASCSGQISIDSSALNLISLIAEYAVDLVEIASLGFMALMILISIAYSSMKHTVILGICMILTKLVYIIPHYYMTFISYGYDSIETLLIALPLSLFILLIITAILAIIVLLSIIPALRKAGSGGVRYNDALGGDIETHEYLNLTNSATAGIAISAIAASGIHIFIAIFETVDVFIKYGASLPPTEILSLVLRYIFLLLVFIGLHFLLCFIKSLMLKNIADTEENIEVGGNADTEENIEAGENSEVCKGEENSKLAEDSVNSEVSVS